MKLQLQPGLRLLYCVVWLLLPDTGCMGAGSHRGFSRESGVIPRDCHRDPHRQAWWQQCFPTGKWLMTPESGTFRIWQQVGGGVEGFGDCAQLGFFKKQRMEENHSPAD